MIFEKKFALFLEEWTNTRSYVRLKLIAQDDNIYNLIIKVSSAMFSTAIEGWRGRYQIQERESTGCLLAIMHLSMDFREPCHNPQTWGPNKLGYTGLCDDPDFFTSKE